MASVHPTERGTWVLAWRFQRAQFQKSLGRISEREAMAHLSRVEATINGVEDGRFLPPATATYSDLKHFFFSGGTERIETKIVVPVPALTLGGLFDRYVAELTASSKEASTLTTENVHMRHLRRDLGEGREVDGLTLADVQHYVDVRGRKVVGKTIRKEVATLVYIWRWGVKKGYVQGPPPAESDLTYPKDKSPEPFRTHDEIAAILNDRKGRMSDDDVERLWEGLYLTPPELRDFRQFIRENATAEWLPMLVDVCLFTGCRRSEALRLRPSDFDFALNCLHLQEKKKKRGYVFSTRTVDLHPELAAAARDFIGWPDGLTVKQASYYLRQTLDLHDKWRHVQGFHVLRHSFGSALAVKGVDQRVINALMGHATDAMARRYQHLVKRVRQSAVDGLLD